MSSFVENVARLGVPLVFANVLVEQLGLPIPALPTLAVAGALWAEGRLSGPMVLAAAVAACLLADAVWYAAGRRQGYRILKTLCRISLSPDSCVRQTESVFHRWGMPSLLVAKFVPGFSTVAPPLAGAIRAPLPAFLLYDGGGSLIWAGCGFVAGALFHRAIDRLLQDVASIGTGALALLGVLLGLFVAAKWWQRRRFYRMLRMARISVDELRDALTREPPPIVVDVRSPSARQSDPRRIFGARVLDPSALDAALKDVSREGELILYCT